MLIFWDEDYNTGERDHESGRVDASEAPEVDVVAYFERNGGNGGS